LLSIKNLDDIYHLSNSSIQSKNQLMYDILKHAHSGLRWVVLALLLFAVLNALMKWLSKAEFKERDRKLNTFAMIFTHVQVTVGLVLYFISDKVEFSGDIMGNVLSRFYVIEHPLTMIIAAVLISIGNSRAKKAANATAKFRTTAIFFVIGLILILSRIPWPFQGLGASWF
jgi:hypothetical protein